MSSTLTWLDYSDRDRRRALDVVDLLRESSTVDELGLGLVRDAFADLLFPGTSTIQTRARYFLFVPWIYRELERLRVPSSQAAARARKGEIALIEALAASGETAGVIGIQARKTLKRLPSNVYWNGLMSWGIRKFPGTHPQYHQSLDGFYLSPRRSLVDDDNNPSTGTPQANWDVNLPAAPSQFPDGATLRLRRLEAEYLRERIIVHHRASMLAFLVEGGQLSEIPFPWEHPQLREFRDPFREQLAHAQRFSEGMHGAQLLYNLMLAEEVDNEELADDYRDALSGWAVLVREREPDFLDWDRRRFWALVVEGGSHVRPRAKDFVESWLDLALSSGSARRIAGLPAARQLIREREHQLKGSRARLENQQALALWQGESGSAQINYRWPVAQAIVNDIIVGLQTDA
ncbi:MAG: DUF6361 family protein [Actinomycetota bacterium]